MENLPLIEESEDIARAWVTAMLNDDAYGKDHDILFFFTNILHPYIAKHGSTGGFALCEALAALASVMADIASRGQDKTPQEMIQLEISMEGG